jgi:hypothetical protein
LCGGRTGFALIADALKHWHESGCRHTICSEHYNRPSFSEDASQCAAKKPAFRRKIT